MTTLRRILSRAIFCTGLATIHAAPVLINNPSFEVQTPELTSGQWTNNLEPNWKETGGPNSPNGFMEWLNLGGQDGTDTLGMVLGHDVWQDLGVTVQANTVYTMNVKVGNRSGFTVAGNQSVYGIANATTGQMIASQTVNASTVATVGNFAEGPALVYDTYEDPCAVGQPLRVLLQARGANRSHFDHIRLDASPSAPAGRPAGTLQAATAITATGATLNATVTDVGSADPSATFYYDTTDKGAAPAAWVNTAAVPGTQNGSFSRPVTGLLPGTTYFVRCRLTNGSGAAWTAPCLSFTTLPNPPVVQNIAATAVGGTSATVGANVTSTGGSVPNVTIYYGTTDGGTNAGSWAANVTIPSLTGSATRNLTGLNSATTYYFRAYAENPGGGSWASASGTFTTLTVGPPTVENRNAQNITGTSAELRGEVTNTGNDTPVVTMYWGDNDGGTVAGNWDNSRVLGPDGGDFSTLVQGLTQFTTYYYTARAVNAHGTAWATPSRSFTTGSALPNNVIINEIHYDPADPTRRQEFIEFYNPTANPINMSGWVLDRGVDFTFPPGTTIAPGAYLVVAENLAHFAAAYPSAPAPVGAWQVGDQLANSGEDIRLRDNLGNTVDEVDYKAGFPWPTSAKGGNVSIELIHPHLNNNLGGNWRPSVNAPDTVVIPRNSTAWRYRQTQSDPPADWKEFAFDDTGAEWATGAFPAGFIGGTPFSPPVTFATTLSFGPDTNNRTRAYYFRKKFTLSAPAAMSFNIRRDDGAVIWINNDPSPTVVSADGAWDPPYPYSSLAPNATQVSTYLNYIIPASKFVAGDNIIAIQLHQSSVTSSDLLIDLDLSILGPKGGTPGAPNSVLAANSSSPPPAIRNVDHSPEMPTAGTPVVITATITDPNTVGTVTLTYQVVSPGSYIPRFTQPATPTFTPALNPAYETGWISLPMNDAGTGGDLAAGDGTFSATIPASVQQHRTLVRYRITAADSLSNTVTVPYPDDEQVNFAYFCYNGVPSWRGAFRPASITAPAVGSTTIHEYSSALLNTIEPFHLIALDADIINCQYNTGSLDRPFSGTFVYRGKVYDNIVFKNRGIGSTYNTGKNKWAIKFNRARDFQAYDNWGRPFKENWNSMSLDANAYPWASVFRGAAGIEEAASYRAHELAGSPSLRTTYAHLRVIRRAQEAATAGIATTESLGTNFDGQYSSDLFGLYMVLEPTEANFLDERNLPDGNLYAIEGNNGDQKYQATNQPTGGADWIAFRTNLVAAGQTEAWYRANLDLPALYNFMGLGRLLGNVDVRPGDNYRFYHRSSDDRWVILAYDLDMMFIAATHWAGNVDGVVAGASPHAINAIKRHPAIALEFRNRCRELISLMASDPSVSGGQIGQLLDEYAQMVNPAGVALTWADLDAAMWNFHPRTTGSTAASGQNSGRANFFRATYSDGTRGGLGGSVQTGSWLRQIPEVGAGSGIGDHEGLTQWFINYATNTYPANTRWTRRATSAGPFSGGTGTDTDVNRQKGYGYKYLEWESLHGGYFNCTTNPPDGVAMGDLTAAGMTRYYAGDSLAQLSAGNHVLYPDKPVITYTGTAGYPVNDVRLRSSDYRDPQGDAISAVQFRVGEISAPGIPLYDPTVPRIYEIEERWTSAEIPTTSGTNIADVRVPTSALRVGRTYRARVRHKDNTGRWSFWSEPLQFVAGVPDVSAYAAALRVTEINYNPKDPTNAEKAHPNWNNALWNAQEFEFIELRNISNASLDLTDVRFTKGIDFDFPASFSLAAGASAVLVKNPVAFAIRYPGVTITGTYGANEENSLSNAGEEIKLSLGNGSAIIQFTYDDALPWPTAPDGGGPTLVLRNPNKPGLNHGNPAEWRSSSSHNGLPGAIDSTTYAAWAQSRPGAGAAGSDGDNDGLDSRLEYALVGDPSASSTAQLPTAMFQQYNSQTYATLSFTRRDDTSDLAFDVQFSTDLTTWNITGVLVESVENGNGTVTEVWRSADPVSVQNRIFGRVQVTQSP